MKTLLVGLDAACWEYLEPLLEEGQMPTLQRLLERGIPGAMHSTMPPWTPTAWATLVTGKNPGKHGVFDMMWRRPGSYEFSPTSSRVRAGTPFWQRLAERGVRVGLVNIPFTYPATGAGCEFVVCGFGTPEGASDFVYPVELSQSPLFAGYQPVVAAETLRSAPPDELLEVEKEYQSRQVQIALALAEQYGVDVLAINLMLTDHANHKMPQMAQVREAYRHADRDLEQLLRSFAPNNVLLLSDHGSSRVQGDFLLNSWLQDQGFFVPARRTSQEQAELLNWILMQYLRERNGWSGPMEKVARWLLRLSVPRLPRALQERFWARIEAALPGARRYMHFANDPDPQQSVVFPGSAYSGLLYLNVAGREEQGVLSTSEREKLVADLAGRLAEITDPISGRPLFSAVYRAEEIYRGPATALAPDLILDAYEMPWNIRTRNSKPILSRIRNGYFVDAVHGRDYGWHSKEGMFVFCGEAFPAAGQSGQRHNLRLEDVPALLLHLYDVPLPEDYDGRVPTELLKPPYAGRPLRSQAGDEPGVATQTTEFSEDEAESLAHHLQALGYLE